MVIKLERFYSRKENKENIRNMTCFSFFQNNLEPRFSKFDLYITNLLVVYCYRDSHLGVVNHAEFAHE